MRRTGMQPPGHWKQPEVIKSEQLSLYAEEKIEKEQKNKAKNKVKNNHGVDWKISLFREKGEFFLSEPNTPSLTKGWRL